MTSRGLLRLKAPAQAASLHWYALDVRKNILTERGTLRVADGELPSTSVKTVADEKNDIDRNLCTLLSKYTNAGFGIHQRQASTFLFGVTI